MAPKVDLKRSMTSHRTWVNNAVLRAEKFIGDNADGLTTLGDKMVAERLIEKIEEKLTSMEKKWTDVFVPQLEVEDPDSLYDEWDNNVHDISKQAENCIDELRKAIKTFEAKGAATSPASTTNSDSKKLKIDTTYKPPILVKASNLEEFYTWEKQFKGYYEMNKAFLAGTTAEMRQLFVTNLLDPKLSSAFFNDKTITLQTPIVASEKEESILKWIKDHLMRHSPLFIRRYEYSNCHQGKKESFEDWWNRKQMKAKHCDLSKVTEESIQITNLICGISNPKLRDEILKLPSDPKLDQLVDLGKRYDTSAYIQKSNFSEEANVNKVSEHRKNKNEKNDQIRNNNFQRNSNASSTNSKCKTCGGSPCWYTTKTPRRPKPEKYCLAKDMICHICNKKGHNKGGCPENINKNKKSTAKSNTVKVNRIVVNKKVVRDDNEPTPTCNMTFKAEEGLKFSKEVLPDTGCSQTIISEDLAKSNKMAVDKKKKKEILNASNERMSCEGTVSFEVKYEGQKTEVLALVSSDLADEILIGWRALQRLNIIPENFPHVIRSASASSAESDQTVRSASASSTESDPALNVKNPSQLLKSSTGMNSDPKAEIEKTIAAFPTVFEEPGLEGGKLKPMKGGPMSIHLKPGEIKPTHIFTARKCPYAFEDHAKAELDKSETMGIVEKVEGASQWCSPCSFVRKAGGGCRLVVDLKGLNDFVLRPTHPFPAAKDIIATIPDGSKRFAVFDCLKGYWQIEVDKKSRHLTTFLTEFGRYRYLRAPMGLSSSGDEFCRRTDEAMHDLEGVKKLVDDILIFADDDETLLKRIRSVFKRCKEWGITLAKSKFQYGNSVKFAGFIVGEDGSKPDPDKVASIRDFPVPKDITNLRSFMGFVNQFSSYSPDLKHAMVPLQPLLKKGNVYQWLPEHQKAFEIVKKMLTSEDGPVLAQFNPKLPVTLITDASRLGLGFILAQEGNIEGQLKLITCGSRFLSKAESNYAVIELECMAIQWAILKCRNYLLGVNFTVKTDHKPLLGVINGKDLDAVNNTRLQRILSKLLGFQFKVEYVPGKLNVIADALSRSPVFQPDEEDENDVLVQALKVMVEPLDPQLSKITEAAAECRKYQQLIEVIKKVPSNGQQAPKVLSLTNLPKDHPAWLYRNFLQAMAFEPKLGLLTVHGKIVVPEKARKSVLESLHIQHTGVVKTWKNAKQLYLWPGMKNEISQTIGNCHECVKFLPSQPKEPCIQTKATRPFEAMSADLGKLDGTWYLICADRFSGWPLVGKLNKLETCFITRMMEDWFNDVGRPLRLRTDGGPQFRSDFDEWCESMGIEHELSSPEHHESNGHAESAVKEMKKLLAKTKTWPAFRKALLEWRNTPRVSDGLSPAQWALGRRQRSGCPALPVAYDRIGDQDFKEALARREEMVSKDKTKFDEKYFHRKLLPSFPVGAIVYSQDFKTKKWKDKGTVVEKKNDRTYIVKIGGRNFRRNRKFLRLCLNQTDPESASTSSAESDQDNPGETDESNITLRRSKRRKK